MTKKNTRRGFTQSCFFNGFTLIELLVVVLIIGILAAVAVPQYQKAVEKSRLTEALTNMKTIQDSMDIFLLENGFPEERVNLEDLDDAGTLQGGFFNDNGDYFTKNFKYDVSCNSGGCMIDIYRQEGRDEEMEASSTPYILASHKEDRSFFDVQLSTDKWTHFCLTNYTAMGDSICKSLESQGFIYVEGEI